MKARLVWTIKTFSHPCVKINEVVWFDYFQHLGLNLGGHSCWRWPTLTTHQKHWLKNIFSCNQAALRMVQAGRPSVRLSVIPFWLCSHHHILTKFSGVITNDQSKVHAKGQGQRSKVKVTEVTTQLNHFRTVTPVWIHIWWWNDAYNFMLLRRGALLFFKVIRQISRSHGSKNRRIWPRLGVSGL